MKHLVISTNLTQSYILLAYTDILFKISVVVFNEIIWFPLKCSVMNLKCFVPHSYDFRILDIATENLHQSFENDFPDNCKEQDAYSRELLEYCCHKALHEVTTRPDYLADKNLRCLMFDMMLAWESPGAQDEFLVDVRTL